jgi:hypothetical protein
MGDDDGGLKLKGEEGRGGGRVDRREAELSTLNSLSLSFSLPEITREPQPQPQPLTNQNYATQQQHTQIYIQQGPKSISILYFPWIITL